MRHEVKGNSLMSYFYSRALVRSVVAALIIGSWIIWYDGPQWSWFLLAFYVAFTFGLAAFMEKRMKDRKTEKEPPK